MNVETELDRHLAELILLEADGRDALGKERLTALVEDVLHLNPGRARSYYHAGLASELLQLTFKPASDDESRRWELHGRIDALLRRGLKERARALLQHPSFASLAADPGVAPRLLTRLAKACHDLGDTAAALDLLEQALALDDGQEIQSLAADVATALLGRADHLIKDAKLDEARRLIETFTGRADLMRRLGYLAVRAYRKLGQCEQKAGDWEEAAARFQQGLAHEPSDSQRAVLWCDLGLCYLGLNSINNLVRGQRRERRVEARAAFEKAVEAGAGFSINGAYALGVLALEEDQPKKASESLELANRSLKAMKMRNRSRIEPRIKAYLAEALLMGRDARAVLPKALSLLSQAYQAFTPSLAERFNTYRLIRTVDEEASRGFLRELDFSQLKHFPEGLSIGNELLALGEASQALEVAGALGKLFLKKPDRRDAMLLELRAENALADARAGSQTYNQLKQLCMDQEYLGELEAALLADDVTGEILDQGERRRECLELYGLMPGREANRAVLLVEQARSYLNARDEEGLHSARALLDEAAILHGDQVSTAELEGLTERLDFEAQRLGLDLAGGGDASLAQRVRARFPSPPRILVVGGNEKQMGDHENFLRLGDELHFTAEWIPANYVNPDKPLATVRARLQQGLKALILLHYNRTEFGRSARKLAGDHDVVLRNLHLYGFKSLRTCVLEVLEKLLRMEEERASKAR